MLPNRCECQQLCTKKDHTTLPFNAHSEWQRRQEEEYAPEKF